MILGSFLTSLYLNLLLSKNEINISYLLVLSMGLKELIYIKFLEGLIVLLVVCIVY